MVTFDLRLPSGIYFLPEKNGLILLNHNGIFFIAGTGNISLSPVPSYQAVNVMVFIIPSRLKSYLSIISETVAI